MIAIFKKFNHLQFGSTLTERVTAAERYQTPIPDSRLLGNLQYARSDQYTRHAIQQIVWDTPTDRFIYRFDSYNADDESRMERMVHLEKPLEHATVLSSDFVPGTIVDQVQKRLILPDGRYIDGPTGDIYNTHGDVLVYRNPDQAKKVKDEEKPV